MQRGTMQEKHITPALCYSLNPIVMESTGSDLQGKFLGCFNCDVMYFQAHST